MLHKAVEMVQFIQYATPCAIVCLKEYVTHFPGCQREKVKQGFQTAVPKFLNYHFDPFVFKVISNYPRWKAENGNEAHIYLRYL